MVLATRYEGIQTKLMNIGLYGCHFLCLCSIAEEFLCKKVDLIDAVNIAIANKLIDEEYTVLNNVGLLEALTGVKWTEQRVKKLPAIIEYYAYTECVYVYKGKTHFKRRAVDTIQNSITAKYGDLTEYRIYTAEV